MALPSKSERFIPNEAFGDEDKEKHRVEPIPMENLPAKTAKQIKEGKKFSNKTLKGEVSDERASSFFQEKNQLEDDILDKIDKERLGLKETEEEDEEGFYENSSLEEKSSDEPLLLDMSPEKELSDEGGDKNAITDGNLPKFEALKRNKKAGKNSAFGPGPNQPKYSPVKSAVKSKTKAIKRNRGRRA